MYDSLILISGAFDAVAVRSGVDDVADELFVRAGDVVDFAAAVAASTDVIGFVVVVVDDVAAHPYRVDDRPVGWCNDGSCDGEDVGDADDGNDDYRPMIHGRQSLGDLVGHCKRMQHVADR